MDPGPTETELLTRATGGDLSALGRLLQLHRTALLGYIQRHFPAELKTFIEPADVLQDTFFDACRCVGRFAPDGGPDCLYRWLVTIARNRMVDGLRERRAAKRGGAGGAEAAGHGADAVILRALEELAVYRRTPSRSAIAREWAAALERAIEGLPADYALAVRLRHIEGLPVAVVAERMGRTEDGVSQVCNRAFKLLRRQLHTASLYA